MNIYRRNRYTFFYLFGYYASDRYAYICVHMLIYIRNIHNNNNLRNNTHTSLTN